MTPIVFNRKSWHYRLAAYGGSRMYTTFNICRYMRAVLWGAFMFFGSCGMMAFLGGLILYIGVLLPIGTLVYLWSPLWDSWLMENYFDVFGGHLVWFVYLMIACAYLASSLYRDYREWRRNQPYKPSAHKPTFLSEAWRSFWDKTCFPVKFDE